MGDRKSALDTEINFYNLFLLEISFIHTAEQNSLQSTKNYKYLS